LRGLSGKIARRRAVRDAYQSALRDLPGVQFMPEAGYGRSNGWLTVVTIDPPRFGATREEIRMHLESCDIESRPAWKPMHMQPAFREWPVRDRGVAAQLFERGLCLPSGSNLTEADQDRVIRSFSLARSVRRASA
jgi:dTDP-4-amino-4,6-dideoxygalactose transaminase